MASIKTLARTLGFSTATISCALSGKGRVSTKTKLRVQQAAEAAGYRSNLLRSCIMSDLRRSKKRAYWGELAVINFAENEGVHIGPFNQIILAGARARASDFGFKVTEFLVGRGGSSLSHVDGVFHSRNIQGVLVLPSRRRPDWSPLTWGRYAGVYADCNVGRPALHNVCCDHFQSIRLLLDQLSRRGYRRIGLFLTRSRDEHVEGRWTAGFQSFQRLSVPLSDQSVPPLIVPGARESKFARWFMRYQPDLVVSHNTEAIAWMERCGARVPKSHGFASLNLTMKTRPCAGLDQCPRHIGARAIELLVALLLRGERGIADSPTTTTVLASWVEGPTVRLNLT